MNKCFNTDEQLKFAQLSGDYNPMHIDSQFARRTMFGSQVVHGINILLTGLDFWCKETKKGFHLTNLRATFKKALTIEEEVKYTYKSIDTDTIRIEARSLGKFIMKMEFKWKEGRGAYYFDNTDPIKTEVLEPMKIEFSKFNEELDLYCNHNLFYEIYEGLGKYSEFDQVATILATTRIVGMRCPGKRSVYAKLDILFAQQALQERKIIYRVSSFDERFNLVEIDAKTDAAKIQITAFHRPKPFEQDSIQKVGKLVKNDEFSQINALIVGGSRGIGAITAKILASGGASVIITYNSGEDEAKKLVEEITEIGGKIRQIQLNVLSETAHMLVSNLRNQGFTHLYYYATPFVFSGSKNSFSASLFNKFNDFYVTAFYTLFTQLHTPNLKTVLYPSTVALEEKPIDMKEYVMAKIAGEELCAFLSKKHNGIMFYVPRLPRIATDQTMSISYVENQDPLPEVLKHVRISNKN